MAQAIRERSAKRHGHGHLEAAADDRQPQLLPRLPRDPHAGVAQDALAGLVDDLRVGGVPREAAPLPEETIGVGLVQGAQRRRPQPAAFEQPQLRQRSASRRAGSSRRP